MKVVNILKYGEITDQYFYKKFLLLLEELSLSEDKRKENYSLRSLDLELHSPMSSLICAASARPAFW